jgi:alginate O-acetyltransferase complex protein AlgI
MLFTSAEFALIFLPLALLAFFVSGRYLGALWAAGLLGLFSLVFYAIWAPRSLLLLGTSIAFNYLVACLLCDWRRTDSLRTKVLLAGAVVINLVALGYFKYLNFLVATVNPFSAANLPLLDIVLPIGISFFTFTQIAYLVDAYRGQVGRSSPLHYLLFVTYFPHLIAGPVLHHAEIMPQFALRETYRPNLENIATGLLFFTIGLAKKVLLADSMQPYAARVFDSALETPPTFIEAWAGALAYTLQLYFDFSGYSDMAVGLSRMFNVRLPYNFASPYQAGNIIEFWRRWHMTLSRFLRDYLYFALGGNRHGVARRYGNLFATMVLGGLWHGAGWGFVLWGALHGVYLMINHAWRAVSGARVLPGADARSFTLAKPVGILITFLCVVFAWVFFRATTLEAAWPIVAGMFGYNGLSPTSVEWVRLDGARQLGWTIVLLFVVLCMPCSQRLIDERLPAFTKTLLARDFSVRLWHCAAVGALGPVIGLLLAIAASRGLSEFIYYNF